MLTAAALFGMVLSWTEHAVFWYMLLLNTSYAALLLMAVVELAEQWHLAGDKQTGLELGAHALPPISVLVPAYNEEATIASSVVSFLTLEYPRHDVVVVNDGSRDATMDVLIAQFDLYEVPPAVNVRIATAQVRGYYRSRRFSRLMVIDKENGGKADSLNAGLNAARHPFVLAVDADTIIEPDALIRLSRPFTLGKSVAAIGGTVRVANGCRVAHGRVLDPRVDSRVLPGIQTVEYLRAFLFGRLGFNRLGGNMIISGAFGLFSRSHLLAIGGYEHGNVTEDMDLVVRLHRWLSDHRDPSVVTFIPDPVAWTEVPTSLAVLGRQRERWHRGLISTMWTRRTMLFNPRHGVIGMITYPFFFFGEMLAPLVELFGYIMAIAAIVSGRFDGAFAILFFSVSVGYGALLSFWAVLLEQLTFRRYTHKHDFWRMLVFALLENVGYRQLTAWWRLKAFYNVARGERGWGKMVREGFRGTSLPAAEPAPAPVATDETPVRHAA
ncbi:MAG: glycosyltransferase family 2 protein [Gemmatimonadaceae bacterium]|nr:glycosyltransferase family 2 protein [Gemmatimonadaceae bacterium]